MLQRLAAEIGEPLEPCRHVVDLLAEVVLQHGRADRVPGAEELLLRDEERVEAFRLVRKINNR